MSDMIEILMWLVVYATLIAAGYLLGSIKRGVGNGDTQAKLALAEAQKEHWYELAMAEAERCAQTTDELLELQEEYQRLYTLHVKLTNPEGHGPRKAGLSSLNDQSMWDAVREGLPETEVDDEFDPYHTEPWLSPEEGATDE